MGSDYTFSVIGRYVLLLAAAAMHTFWPAPRVWDSVLLYGLIAYWIAILQTEPAMRFARHLPSPWAGWMALYAARAHAFGGALTVIVMALLEREYVPPYDPTGMAISTGWEREAPSVFAIGTGIAAYVAVSVGWALIAAAVSRRMWGAVEPEPRRFRIHRNQPRAHGG